MFPKVINRVVRAGVRYAMGNHERILKNTDRLQRGLVPESVDNNPLYSP